MTILAAATATAPLDRDAEDRRRSVLERATAPRRINLDPRRDVADNLDHLDPYTVAVGREWMARTHFGPNGWYADRMIQADRYLAQLRRS